MSDFTPFGCIDPKCADCGVEPTCYRVVGVEVNDKSGTDRPIGVIVGFFCADCREVREAIERCAI